MIHAIGIDIADVQRMRQAVERWGEAFLDKIFTESETAFCRDRANRYQALAARFAAKEAVSKCLGTGFRRGVSPRMIEIVDNEHSRPTVKLHGRAAEAGAGHRFHLSLSHERAMVVAVAVMEKERKQSRKTRKGSAR
ncbi:MAG TPA: holo-[acyl-carrier-protein] synthase [candidate division Zixibacteria bacterium]|nr:holo-[acyl-carrier-protein] synthase [candidate division Zixibacteria bacterium]